MALRAFQANPSIGGFGGESHFGRLHSQSQIAFSQSKTGDRRHGATAERTGDATSANGAERRPLTTTENIDGQFDSGSCDAFAQIVKELVDNAVDACAPAANDNATQNEDAIHERKIMKRVRVDITSATVAVRANAEDEDPTDNSGTEDARTMNCLRVVISDNGCGMDSIDDCVAAFRSNKIGTTKQSSNVDKVGHKQRGKSSESTTQSNAKEKKKDDGKNKQKKPLQQQQPSSEKYTSGRYGVGLTLCLLHAQRLVPGTGACITSATASAEEWTRATFDPDTDADSIVCKKKEHFPKEVEDECGTTISLYVPGGEAAKRAWPRLAEYFARFQLSIDLPCSLEVKAPTLQLRPLYIRPPAEIERRMLRKKYKVSAPASSQDTGDETSDSDDSSIKRNWDGGDGFDEGGSPISAERNNQQEQPKTTSKAARERAEAELQTKKKMSLLHKAASTFKSRPDLKIENVAYASQPIRRNTGAGHSSYSKNGPILEIGVIMFGQQLDGGNYSDDGECENYHEGQRNKDSSAKLQVVRMVNGIPLLDSSEALACGVVQKISNNAATWNSFGLEVQKSDNDLDATVPLNERNTPTFKIDDSVQVAPFLKTTAHSMFEDPSQDYDQSSNDEDGFDVENTRETKRKKGRKARCILPASLRLGDVLIVVQIRAKPSALPLPTLSKGRLPLNDKGISDALENGISDCLRRLQRSSPGLLLTAHQLKRVERDVKYVPSVSSAVASVICRSRQISVFNNAMNAAASWDDEVKQMGALYSGNKVVTAQRKRRPQSTLAEMSNGVVSAPFNEERLRVDALRSILERRLRFVVSDEFKDAKKAEEKEKQRMEREEIAAAKKRAKKNKAVESDGMKSDCFDSDGGGNSGHPSVARSESSKSRSPKKSDRNEFRDDFNSDVSSSPVHTRRRRWKRDSICRSEHSSVDDSERDRTPKKTYHVDFDSVTSSPVVQTKRRHWKGGSVGSSKRSSSDECSRKSPVKSSCNETGNDESSRVWQTQRNRQQHNPTHSIEHPGATILEREKSPQKPSRDELGSEASSPIVHTERSGRDVNADDDFGDGYESSPRQSNGQVEAERNRDSVVQRPDFRFRSGRLSHDGFESNGSLSECTLDTPAKQNDDAMSIESKWSAQYGELVPGQFFR